MKIVYFGIIAFFSISLQAQEYFQQEVNTTIKVELDDKNHELSAFESITYINNSPDTLHYIIVHLWPNAYRNNGTAMAIQSEESGDLDFHFADKSDRGYIDSLDFKVDDQTVKFNFYQRHIDIGQIWLNEPLLPGKSIYITTPFRVKIPKGIYSRLGHIGESYQITQWYPKPAVYDKKGWHPLPYLTQGEFYSEFGSFDVSITLPENYILGATGDMVDGEKELDFLNRRVAYTETLLKDASDYKENPNMEFPPSSENLKTLRFKQNNVHDFAWFADKRYLVLKGEVELPFTQRKVTTWAMFTENEQHLWKNSIAYLNDALFYYSKWTGEYPYNHCTAVDGSISAGGGMEYPNITVIGESYSALGLEQVIVHEVGHNWFYGILGTNERVNAWMDEGMNQYTENRYTEVKYKGIKYFNVPDLPGKLKENFGFEEYDMRGLYDLGYLFNARRNYDQPLASSSEKFTSINYGALVYGKTAIGFDFLLAYLGDELFDKCMLAYFDKWKFKHPEPEDLANVFTEVSEKNLSWFFDDFIKTNKKIDYAITGVKRTTDGYEVTVINKSQIAAPFSLSAIEGDTTERVQQWFEGHEGKQKVFLKSEEVDQIILDYHMDIPELKRTDDLIKTKGLFKTIEPIRFQLLGGIENRRKTTIYYAPILGWNQGNGLMPGIALYNTVFPEKKLEWMVLPMYGTKTKNLTGSGDLTYNIYPSRKFRKISLNYNLKKYDQEILSFQSQGDDGYLNWQRQEIAAIFELKPLNYRKRNKHTISLRGIHINESLSVFKRIGTYGLINYELLSRQVLKPGKFNAMFLTSSQNTRVELEITKKLNYNIKLQGITFRWFGGVNLTTNNNRRYNFQATGQDGYYDFLYDRIYLNRNALTANMLSQQMSETHGAIKNTAFANISSSTWLSAVNVKSDLPISPIKIFVEGAIFPYQFISSANQNGPVEKVGFALNTGIYFKVVKDICEIYLPLYFNSSFNLTKPSFLQSITFKLDLHKVNPYKIVRQLEP